MAGNQIHNLDVKVNYTTVSGTAAGTMTVLAAPGANWTYRVYKAFISNDATNANTFNLQPGTAAEPRIFVSTPALDSKEVDMMGAVWELPENNALEAVVDDTPTGQVAVTVAWVRRYLK